MSAPSFINLSFEDAGAGPGEADGWTQYVSTAAEMVAAYGPDPVHPWEHFEGGWGDNETDEFAFLPADLTPAQYVVNHVGPTPVYAWHEPFEGMWHSGPGGGNEEDIFELGSIAQAVFYMNTSPATLPETFGNLVPNGIVMIPSWLLAIRIGWDWSNSVNVHSFDETNCLVAAQYGTGLAAVETFESEWRSNETDQDAFAPGDLAAAHYGEVEFGAYAAETFEALYKEISFVPFIGPPDTARLASAHGLVVGNLVRFRTVNGQLPHPLSTSVRYRVSVNTGAREIEVVVDATSAAVNWNPAQIGFGTNVMFRDPEWYWHTVLL